jgi:hypothetical protein
VEKGISTQEEFSGMANMTDQDTRTERKQVFDTQPPEQIDFFHTSRNFLKGIHYKP